ncbi:MAG: hypothetical protein HFG62_12395 [Lachnospiraceae bacterium]|nr:hypothetical protein [Lachnospiraceae bacterium]
MESDLEVGAEISVNGDLDAGLGISAGLAAGGVIPALIDLRLLGVDALGKANGKLTVLPDLGFQGEAEINGSVYSKIEGRLKLKVSKEKDGVDAAIEVDEVIRPDIGSLKNGKITWGEFQLTSASIIPATLKLNAGTALKAVDRNGTDISDQFDTYDSKTKKVIVKPDGAGGYSFQCPRYYTDDDSRIYEITEIVSEADETNDVGITKPWASKLDLDLTEVTGLKSLVLPTSADITLDLSQNKELELLCTHKNRIGGFNTEDSSMPEDGSNNADIMPIPDKFADQITSMGVIDGSSLDLSGCPKLRTLWIKIKNADKIDLSKNSSLRHLGLNFTGDPKQTELVFSSNHATLKTLRVFSESSKQHLKPIPLSRLTGLEYAEFFATAETQMDFSRCTALKYLILSAPSLKTLNLGRQDTLQYLNMKNTKIDKLDIENCPKLDNSNKIIWNYGLLVFTGNGSVFPQVPAAGYYGNWYTDEKLQNQIMDTKCDKGQTIYRYGYTPSSRTAALTATASNAKKATDSNASSAFSDSQAPDRGPLEQGTAEGAGNGSGADGSTAWTATGSNLDSQSRPGNTGNGLWDSGDDDDDDEAFEDFELELVNDLFYAMALGSSGGRVRVRSAEWLSPEAAGFPAGLTEGKGGVFGSFPARKTKLPLAPTGRGRQNHTWFYIPETGSSLKPEGEDGEQ